jgi:hypothetical protein
VLCALDVGNLSSSGDLKPSIPKVDLGGRGWFGVQALFLIDQPSLLH